MLPLAIALGAVVQVMRATRERQRDRLCGSLPPLQGDEERHAPDGDQGEQDDGGHGSQDATRPGVSAIAPGRGLSNHFIRPDQ
jgi:hypothetical protein